MGAAVTEHVIGPALIVASAAGAVLALALAAVVLATDPRRQLNRRLAGVLAADGLLMGTLSTSGATLDHVADTIVVDAVLTTVAIAYVCFLATLDTPLTRPLRRRGVLATALVGLVVIFALDIVILFRRLPTLGLEGADPELPWPLVALTSLAALIATVVAYRRAERGTQVRRRAGFFALAFGTRDLLFATGILGWGALDFVGRSDLQAGIPLVLALGVVLFASLLAYGILSTQLFDIDLRIKRGISRSTVATLGIAAVLIAAKTAEFYLNSTVGFVAGGFAAGLVLFLAPRLNKLGDKVANTAMPKVQPTSSYLEFKKMEVYRAAVESALENDGGIDKAERAMLDRLRAKLGIPAEDAEAMEREVAEPFGAPEPAAA